MKELIPFSAKGFFVSNLIIVPFDFTSMSIFVISYLITFNHIYRSIMRVYVYVIEICPVSS